MKYILIILSIFFFSTAIAQKRYSYVNAPATSDSSTKLPNTAHLLQLFEENAVNLKSGKGISLEDDAGDIIFNNTQAGIFDYVYTGKDTTTDTTLTSIIEFTPPVGDGLMEVLVYGEEQGNNANYYFTRWIVPFGQSGSLVTFSTRADLISTIANNITLTTSPDMSNSAGGVAEVELAGQSGKTINWTVKVGLIYK